MLYPVLFRPIYKSMLWGGARMRGLYRRDTPFERTGESWDISCRPGEMGVIENGPDAGLAFDGYIRRDPRGVLGAGLADRAAFPLLVKIIDADAHLSVQVHPGGADTGKNEMWYIMEAPDEGCLIAGLRPGVTRESLRRACADGTVVDLLHRLPVRRGDMVNIPAGLVHALTQGVVVAEVQQNADITYRLYDYGRLDADGQPRALHVAESLDAIDFHAAPPEVVAGDRLVTPYFTAQKLRVTESVRVTADPQAFCVYTCVDGACEIAAAGMRVAVTLSRSVFIPAGLGDYEITGACTLLQSTV